MLEVTVTPKNPARISNPNAHEQKEITFVLRIATADQQFSMPWIMYCNIAGNFSL
ncbi:rCG60420 [Rattus norvegicus]|uniref:RCG60420 n=1 Tax=Rattus norvegicus TaxID=10116 RepID=A6KKH9_RAT|nr:rCG60420 [Rattus norvegicus]